MTYHDLIRTLSALRETYPYVVDYIEEKKKIGKGTLFNHLAGKSQEMHTETRRKVLEGIEEFEKVKENFIPKGGAYTPRTINVKKPTKLEGDIVEVLQFHKETLEKYRPQWIWKNLPL